jgi:hypothetical protein
MAQTADIGTVLQSRPHPRFMLVSDLDHTMVSAICGTTPPALCNACSLHQVMHLARPGC